MSDQVRLMTDSAIIINRIASLQEEHGIAFHIKDKPESARLAGFGSMANDVDIYVHQPDRERAQLIVEELRKDQ